MLTSLTEPSAAADGWIIFDDVQEEILIPMAEWKQRFKEWSQQ
jgi:hypothetical protein